LGGEKSPRGISPPHAKTQKMANLIQRLRNFIARRRRNKPDSESSTPVKSNGRVSKLLNRGDSPSTANGKAQEQVTSVNGGTRGTSTVINGGLSNGKAVIQEESQSPTTLVKAEGIKEISVANGTANGTVNGTAQLPKSSSMESIKNAADQAKESVKGAVEAVTAGVAGTSIAGASAAGASDSKLLKDDETGEMVSKSERM
jgi:hypothetical protein